MNVRPGASAAPGQAHDELELVQSLRRGDEEAFRSLVERHNGAMLRTARMFVRDLAIAEEAVQETWLAVVRGLERFEGRASLRTWLFRILANRVRSLAEREGRTLSFSTLNFAGAGEVETAVDPSRFTDDASNWPGHWSVPPEPWSPALEERLLASEARDVIRAAILALPPAQRAAIYLRDVQGFRSDEVCDVLGVTLGNQRVLLHRARSRVRSAINGYLDEQ